MLPITDLPKRALQLFATLAAVSGRYRYKVVRPDAGLSSALGTTRRLDDWVTVKGEAGS